MNYLCFERKKYLTNSSNLCADINKWKLPNLILLN